MRQWFAFILECVLTLIFGQPMHSHPCPTCDAEGRIAGGWCPECQGKRWLRTPEEQEAFDEWNKG